MPNFWLDDETHGQLKRLAELNRRSMVEELRIAVENYAAKHFSGPNQSVTVAQAVETSQSKEISDLIHRLGGDQD